MAVKHYAIDPRKLTLAEYWRAPQRGSFLAGLIIKALPVTIDVARAIPLTETLIELDPNDLPDVAKGLQSAVEAFEALGFELAFYYKEDIVSPRGDQAAVTLLSPDGRTYATAILTQVDIGGRTAEERHLSFVSRGAGGIFVTSTGRGEMDSPPEIKAEVATGTVADAWAHHQQRIQVSGDAYRGAPVATTFDRDELRAFVVALSNRVVEWNAARGVFTPMSGEEVTALRRGEPTTPARRPSPAATVAVWVGLGVVVAILAWLI